MALPKVIEIVREFLKAVNTETGKAENRFNLLQLDQQLLFKSGEQVVSEFDHFEDRTGGCLMFTAFVGSAAQGRGSGADLQGRIEQTRW